MKQLPPLPASRSAMTLPNQFLTTQSGQPFLLEAGPNNDYLIFCTPNGLIQLSSSNTWSMDGTFDCVPTLYTGGQLFTIHVFQSEKLLPVVYCLTATKSSNFYVNLFNVLNRKAGRLGLHLNPNGIMSDFESGLIPAISQSFPQCRHHGCYFHFCQAIYRQVQSLGLVQAYESRPDIRLHIRKLMAIAFLPLHLVRVTFAALEYQSDAMLLPLFHYFRTQWLTAATPSMWNVYGEDLRTNNDCEGWHLRINNAVGSHHPNIWKFLCCILEEQAATEVLRQQIISGRIARRKRSTYINVQRRLATLKQRFDSGVLNVDDYLEGVSHNLAERH
jgi:hypothetical protein